MVEKALYLSAVVPGGSRDFEVRMGKFSQENVERLIENDAIVIVLAPEDDIDPRRLFRVLAKRSRVLGKAPGAARAERSWRLYECDRSSQEFVTRIIRSRALVEDAVRTVKRDLSARGHYSCAFIVRESWVSRLEGKLTSVCREAMSAAESDRIDQEPVSAARKRALPLTGTRADAGASDSQSRSAAARREALIEAKKHMLKRVGTVSSEEVAAGAGSISSNASQFAADQRAKGALLGVKFGQEWLYPRFQFDERHRVLPEIRDIVATLSPDETGWDRLQWFLEPHERLGGRTPLEVWEKNREQVIKAARSEHWDGRD